MADFTHLHVHTQYSLLDGMNRIDKLFEKVKDLKMHSVAMTDHGVLYGVGEFWKMAKDFEVKPIIGCEIYLAPREHSYRGDVNGIKYYHLLLLAKNLTGYLNLSKLVSTAHIEGMYYKPRVDIKTLKKYSEGLICTSACLAGPLSRHIIRDELETAENWLKQLHAIFKDDFYLEVQRNGFGGHDDYTEDLAKTEENKAGGYDEESVDSIILQVKVNKKLREWSDQYKIPLVATTDAHYLNAEDKDVQKILFCIKDGVTINDPRARNGYTGTYIKTAEEMTEAFSDDLTPIENTMVIDEKIEKYSIKFDRVQPKYWNLPKDKDAKVELQEQTYEGAKKRYGEITPELKERIDFELMVIDKMGYNDYFLVVGDIMQSARKKGIVVGARGSAAGSVVAYALDITNAEPIKWELYFERFLNLERASPPDIDMDIQDDRRDEIIQYAKEKYGEDNVAAICTFGKLMTKAAIRDVARVMGIDLAIADKLSKMVIVLFGKPFKFEDMMKEDPEFKRIVESNPDLITLGEAVKKIEGLNRHTGVHAAGYLITPKPVTDYMSIFRDSRHPDNIVTQLDGTWIDKLDFMKFDFLGLRTLTIIKNTLDYVKRRKGIDINIQTLPEDDPKAFELFSKGETVGVFQFESPPMQQYLKELKPENIEDICFLAAAYRPGPMKYIPDYILCKHGKKEAEYLIPELEPILDKTFGFPIYQEQLLRICMEFGGFTLGEGDVIRNALKKKQLDILQTKEGDFIKAFVEKYPNYGEEKAKELWGQLKPFADYGFNKAHSASYAVVAYWCAYLKAYYPLEFITALMHSDVEAADRVIVDIIEARRMGFEVLQPNINASEVDFAPEGENSIRFGLAAIKNVGMKVCEHIVEERKKNGPYKHLDDLINRVGSKNINKKAVECLIKGGAMDDFGDRNALLAIILQVFEKIQREEKAHEMGQTGLFASLQEDSNVRETFATPFPQFEDASDQDKMFWEKDLLGLFITTHPLEKFKWVKLHTKLDTIKDLEKMRSGSSARLIAMFNTVKVINTKADNKKMAVMNLEDPTGKFDSVIFPRTFEKYVETGLINEHKPLLISGKVNEREERKSLIIEELEPANILKAPKRLRLDIRNVNNEEDLAILKTCIFPSEDEVELEILYGTNGNTKVLKRYTNFNDENRIDILSRWILKS